MGLDLRLLPVDFLSGTMGFSHTVLIVHRDGSGAINAIAGLVAAVIPTTFDISSFVGGRVPDGAAEGEPMYGSLADTAYGERYTWIDAARLAPILQKHQPDAPTTAYIAALPPATLVILDWH